MSLMAYPSNAVDALQSVANMTDDIWYHANDTSTDVSTTYWHFFKISAKDLLSVDDRM